MSGVQTCALPIFSNDDVMQEFADLPPVPNDIFIEDDYDDVEAEGLQRNLFTVERLISQRMLNLGFINWFGISMLQRTRPRHVGNLVNG